MSTLTRERLILLRTGVVMGNGGGIIQNTIPSFKLGLGGPISLKGDQIINWIHMDDEVGIIKVIPVFIRNFLIFPMRNRARWTLFVDMPVQQGHDQHGQIELRP